MPLLALLFSAVLLVAGASSAKAEPFSMDFTNGQVNLGFAFKGAEILPASSTLGETPLPDLWDARDTRSTPGTGTAPNSADSFKPVGCLSPVTFTVTWAGAPGTAVPNDGQEGRPGPTPNPDYPCEPNPTTATVSGDVNANDEILIDELDFRFPIMSVPSPLDGSPVPITLAASDDLTGTADAEGNLNLEGPIEVQVLTGLASNPLGTYCALPLPNGNADDSGSGGLKLTSSFSLPTAVGFNGTPFDTLSGPGALTGTWNVTEDSVSVGGADCATVSSVTKGLGGIWLGADIDEPADYPTCEAEGKEGTWPNCIEPSGSISGAVTDSSEEPLENICVRAYSSEDEWDQVGSTETDSSGSYRIRGLDTGDYKVQFRDCSGDDSFETEFYDDKSDFDTADKVLVKSGQDTGEVDASLAAQPERILRGEISWETDADIDLHVWDAQGNEASYRNPQAIPGGRLSQDIVPSPGDDSVKLEFFSDRDTQKPLGFCVFNFNAETQAQTQVEYRLRQLDGSFSTGQVTLGNRQWGILGSVPAGSVSLDQRCANQSATTQLQVERLGSGSGTVTSNPSGIDCGGDCSEEYDRFTQVTLTANPAEGSTFAGWIVSPSSLDSNCPGTGPCRVSLSEDRRVRAVFNQTNEAPADVGIPDVIAPRPPGGGTVPINEQTNEDGQTYITIPFFAPSLFPDNCLPLTLNIPINPGAGITSNVLVRLNDNTYPASQASPGIWRVEIDCVESGSLWLSYTLTEGDVSQDFLIPIGGIELIDPQGVVYDTDLFDAAKAEGKTDEEARAAAAISGATVRLQRLVDGEFVNVLSGDPGITPNVNPQITGEDGLYQWDVSEGTYRVVVTKNGYPTVTSNQVDIPPPVLDLHIPMTKPRLSVEKSGSGQGSVTSTPAGIDCGSDCSESLDYGSQVTLTASAATGSTFTGWSGACSGETTCQVTMEEARSVIAQFTANPALGTPVIKAPKKAKKGKEATFKVTIKNMGGSTATGVKISAKGKKIKVSKTIGSLAAGKSKTVPISIKFTKAGKIKVTFTVTSTNAGKKTSAKTVRVS